MDIADLREIMSLLRETDITELQIEKDGLKIKLRRDKLINFGEIHHHAVPDPNKDKPLVCPLPHDNHITVTAPIIGTFYRAPSPDAQPFVEVGTMVRKGQVLCIIEAMKLMNEIESEYDGVIARIFVDSGHPVEYGEPLFLIEKVTSSSPVSGSPYYQ